MQSMLDSYLSFARGEAEEDVGTVSLNSVVEKVAADGRLRGATVNVSVQGDDEINVRPNAFDRLLTNLVSNACRHADEVSIEAINRGRWLTINIDDDGPGIPADAREDVFRPFYRLDAARNQDETGTGLGLAIVRDIARSHGGDVTLSDSAMGGLRATVRLPA
jgi:two-component system osmolarity sensor histidine kinase EnvZ